MNHLSKDIEDYSDRFLPHADICTGMDVLFFVPAPYLFSAVERLGRLEGVEIGAQNLYWEPSGAFTGEISSRMILDTGATRVLIGHSERRKYFGETDETVNRKMKAAVGSSLMPVLCIGETLQERESGRTEDVTERSLLKGIGGIDEEDLKGIVIAYEPVWAIGTGVNATPEQAEAVHAMLRGLVAKEVSANLAKEIPILYGGSANPDNTGALMAEPDIDGLLVGGASLDPESFSKMIALGAEACGCRA
jgi:triosephosphate isomerase